MAESDESVAVENRPSPYKMTPERVELYLSALAQGQRRGIAARAAGVTRDTIVRWRRLDPDFAAAAEEAELDAHEQVEDALYQAAVSGNVTAIQVYLYNRLPDRWRDQRNLNIAGPGGGPIEHAVRRYDELDDEQLAAAEREAATRLADEGARAVAEAQRILKHSGQPGPRAGRGRRPVRDPEGKGSA